MQTLTFFMFWKKKGGLKLKRRSSPKQMLDTLQRFAWCLILWSFSLRIGLLLYKNPYMTYVPTIIAWTFPGLTSRLTLTSHVHFSKGNNITRIVINYSILDNEYVHIVSYHCLLNLCRESTIVQQQCSVFGNIVVPKKSQDLHKVYINFTGFLKRNDYVSSTTPSRGLFDLPSLMKFYSSTLWFRNNI